MIFWIYLLIIIPDTMIRWLYRLILIHDMIIFFLNKIIFFLIFLFISWRYSFWLIFNDMIYVGFIGRYSSLYDDRLILLANTS